MKLLTKLYPYDCTLNTQKTNSGIAYKRIVNNNFF